MPGRPALYATTKGFLDYFNLKSLEELPSLAEIRDIDSINEKLELSMPGENAGLAVEEDVAESTDINLEDEAPAEEEKAEVDKLAEPMNG